MVILLISVPMAAAQQLPTVICSTPQRLPRDFWDYWSLIATPIGTVVALLIGFITINRNIRDWKWNYFTKEWSTLLQFVLPHSKFMDCALTADYKTNFPLEEAVKYEMIARLCIGYLDDLYFIGSKCEINSWLSGSFRLLAGTHRVWLEDNKGAYDKKFYDFVMRKLTDKP